MLWLKQTGILICKNYIIHRRQKLRVFMEIIWPLLIMSVLMWVRTKGLRVWVHECHFNQKAMPTSGFFTFLQSAFCSFNNTCNPQITDDINTVMGESPDIYVANQIQAVFKRILTPSKLQSFSIIINKDFEAYTQLIQYISNPDSNLNESIHLYRLFLTNKIENILIDRPYSLTKEEFDAFMKLKVNLGLITYLFRHNNFTISSILCPNYNLINLFIEHRLEDRSLMSEVRKKICNAIYPNLIKEWKNIIEYTDKLNLLHEFSKISKERINVTLHISDLLIVVDTLTALINEVARIKRFRLFFEYLIERIILLREAIEDPWSNSMKFIYKFFCDRNDTHLYQHFLSGNMKIDHLQEEINQYFEQNNNNTYYIYDNTTTKKCNNMFQNFEHGIVKVIWKQIKPFIRGKIIYTPKSDSLEELLQEVNKFFDPIKDSRELINIMILELIPQLKLLLNDVSKSMNVTKLIIKLFDTKMVVRHFKEKFKYTDNEYLNNIEMIIERMVLFFDFFLTNGSEFLISVNYTLKEIKDYLQCFELNKIESYENESTLVLRGTKLMSENKLWAGLVFENMNTSDKLPPYVRYKIRMDSSRVDSTKKVEDRIARPGSRRRPAIDLKYITFGFAYLQDLIESSIIKAHTNTSDYGIILQQFPYPCHLYDYFTLAISRSFPLFMVLSWCFSISMIIKSVVFEKERRLKEVMKLMGLKNAPLWLSWFIDSFVFMVISSFLLTLILIYGNILTFSNPIIVFLFLLSFCISIIFLGFLISTFFQKANVAAAGGGMIFFMTYFPYPFLVLWEDRLNIFEKGIFFLLSNVAFGFGCHYISQLEEEGIGIQWHNISLILSHNDVFSFQTVMLMLLFDACLYGILTWYIEAIYPGNFGVPKPFYFPLTINYWFSKKKSFVETQQEEEPSYTHNNSHFEEEPKNLVLGISVKNLTKVFNKTKVAVNNLSLNFYEGQITSFLGHNGAGKTTTISILTGLYPATSGTAKVYGLDIRKDMDDIRKSLGICPQYNVLFDNFTVYEHLWFYASLKSKNYKSIKGEIDIMLKDLGLFKKRNEFTCNLSGGMQRKLSVALAFIGKSRTVILDEPTAGVDPYSRRSIWELLLRYKTGRTVILTTHHMDEADLLGDRIAVISRGKLLCCGSSLFLKSHFGRGYYLTFVIKDISDPTPSHIDSVVSESESSDSSAPPKTKDRKKKKRYSRKIQKNREIIIYNLVKFIKKYVKEATLIESVGTELSFGLPLSAQDSGHLQILLEELDLNLDSLCISSYGISSPPLEEVFLKVTGIDEESGLTVAQSFEDKANFSRIHSNQNQIKEVASLEQEKKVQNESKKVNGDSKLKNNECIPLRSFKKEKNDGLYDDENEIEETIEGPKLIRRQFLALQEKRYHHNRRNPRALLCQILLPALFLLISMIFTLVLLPVLEEPPLELKPWLYEPPNYVFFSDDSLGTRKTKKLTDELLGPVGMGTKCVKAIPEKYKMLHPKLSDFFTFKRSKWPKKCFSSVDKSKLIFKGDWSRVNEINGCICNSSIVIRCDAPIEPPKATMVSGDIIFNLTGRNISDWLVKSERIYRKHRFGGFTFSYGGSSTFLNRSSLNSLFLYILNFILRYTKNLKNDFIKFLRKLNEKYNRHTLDFIKVWFNNKGWTSSVTYLNAINNVILRSSMNTENRSYYGISVINHPMNFTQDQIREELMKTGGVSLIHSISVLFAMSFVPASFVLYLIDDRVSGSKHMQYVNGITPKVYWIAAYVWDMCNYLIPSILCVIIFFAFNAEAYVAGDNIYGFSILLFLYGFSSIPFMYPASYIFDVPSSAFVVLASLNLFIGIFTAVSTFVLEMFDDIDLKEISAVLKKLFLILPHFCLGRGLMDMSSNHVVSQIFAKLGLNLHKSPFQWNHLGRNMLCMFLQGVIAFLFVLFLETSFIRRMNFRPKVLQRTKDDVKKQEDDDVVKERQAIISGNREGSIVLVENLTKLYRKSESPAVNKLWISVEAGECFGLLGVNGAGKTTTFKMLTGDLSITSGDALIAGHSVKNDLRSARKHIGYCPQFDALDLFLTGREHLEFYAKIRGITDHDITRIVDWCIKKLALQEYQNIPTQFYSSGNKRKLSTAIALVSSPSVIFLDEPTTGMDPKARRFLWNCITSFVKSGRAVVLTSHSMEECEALCTRLALMVNGELKCIGSIQHLKSKFGEGYTVRIRFIKGDENKEKIKKYMNLCFNNKATIKSEHYNQFEYHISSSIRLSLIFKIMQEGKKKLPIENYSVTQTTLDEVFIRFAQQESGNNQ